MSTRKTSVASAVESLADFTVGDVELKQRNLDKIPAPTFIEGIEWERIYSDRNFNVRDDDSYSFDNNKELYYSLMDRGFEMRGGDNMSFSEQPDGRLLIIAGNLRYAMMDAGRKETLRLRAETNEPTTTDNPLPFQTLFGLVFTSLTREQETDLMADHTMSKKLNEFELCKEIGEACYRLNLTDEKAAIKFGLNKSTIGRCRMRYNMPRILAEYRKEKSKDNVPFIKVGQKALTHLYTCYHADFKAGCGFRAEGANFKQAWAEHIRNPEVTGVKPEKEKGQDRKDILNQRASLAGTFGNNPEVTAISDVLAWAANEQRDGKVVSLQDAIIAVRDYCNSLRSERDSAIGRILELSTELESVKQELAEERKSMEDYANESSGRIHDLEAELDSVKSKAKASK